jgi:hypothetical protein
MEAARAKNVTVSRALLAQAGLVDANDHSALFYACRSGLSDVLDVLFPLEFHTLDLAGTPAASFAPDAVCRAKLEALAADRELLARLAHDELELAQPDERRVKALYGMSVKVGDIATVTLLSQSIDLSSSVAGESSNALALLAVVATIVDARAKFENDVGRLQESLFQLHKSTAARFDDQAVALTTAMTREHAACRLREQEAEAASRRLRDAEAAHRCDLHAAVSVAVAQERAAGEAATAELLSHAQNLQARYDLLAAETERSRAVEALAAREAAQRLRREQEAAEAQRRAVATAVAEERAVTEKEIERLQARLQQFVIERNNIEARITQAAEDSQRDQQALELLMAEADALREDQLCPVCWDRNRTHILIPCMHTFCADCAGGNACPACRQKITACSKFF